MLGIDYVSSDEEEAVPVAKPELPIAPASLPTPAPVPTPAPAPASSEAPPVPSTLPEGPSQGPSAIPQDGDDHQAEHASTELPYTSSRLMVQNLTLPTVPNLNIPASPPGSPPRRATQKFAQFLELKKKGQHFNQRLESSSVVRDPNHSRKLMDFAGITDEDQYASTLPEGLGAPVIWPAWAYGDALNASQKKITKAKESERSRIPRSSVDFVSARGGASSDSKTPAGKGSRQSAAERVLSGSDSRPLREREQRR